MRKWRNTENKTRPLQRLFSSNMPLLWYCYDVVACSTKEGALEENIQLAVGAGVPKDGLLYVFLQLPCVAW